MREGQIKKNTWIKSLKYQSWAKLIINYSQYKAARYGANHMAFAFFMTLNYTVPFFMHTHASSNAYKWVLLIKTIGTLLCVGLFLEPYWLKKYFAIYWHFSLLYCLPFSFTFLFLVNGSNVEWLVNISLAITLLIVLSGWHTFILTFVLGITLALGCYRQFIGQLPLLDSESWYTLSYTCLFAMLVGLIFARRKELDFDFLMLRNLYLTKKQKRTQEELIQALNYREELLKELNPDEIAVFNTTTSAYIKQAIYQVKNYLRLVVSQFKVDELLQAVQDIFQILYAEDNRVLIIQSRTKQQELEADFDKLKQLVNNSIGCMQQLDTLNNPIRLAIEDTLLGHHIVHMKNYIRKLEAVRVTITLEDQLPKLKSLYMIQSNKTTSTLLLSKEQDWPLLENTRIIEAHYGYASIENSRTHVYVVPVHIRKIRGEVMELLKNPAIVDPNELSQPLAIELEAKLMNKLQGTQVGTTIIQKALDLIRTYHGGVRRKSGEPFFTHPMSVALILLDYTQDQDTVLAALLHDTVEDTKLSMAHIKIMFGDTVAFLVDKTTNLEDGMRRISLQGYENLCYENLYHLVNHEDEQAALVKLSDRLHNMRTIQGHPSLFKQKEIAQETLTLFVPLAKRLKVAKMAQELEEISLDILSK